jgi:hypothetical protein
VEERHVLVCGDILRVLELPGVGWPDRREVSDYKWYQSQLSHFHGRVWSQLRMHGEHGSCES